MESRFDYRLTFSKSDRAVYISHLDLMRTMQRAFKRANLPIWYTKGFNPHAYIMFPLALSLGVMSDVEVMDVALTEEIPSEDVVKRLNASLPLGLKIMRAASPVNDHKKIKQAEYEILFEGEQDSFDDFNRFISQDRIEIKKITKKKKEKIIDIKQYLEVSEIENNGEGLLLRVLLPAGCDNNINPGVLTDAFSEFSKKSFSVRMKRVKILMDDGNDYF